MKTFLHNVHHHLVTPLLELLFPPICLHCQQNTFSNAQLPVCPSCYSQLTTIDPQWVQANVYQRIPTPYLDGLVVALEFNAVLQTLIHYMKYKMMARIGKQLGQLIAPLVAEHLLPTNHTILVPVPLHRKRLRERGYNQSEHIARGLAYCWGLPVHPEILRRIRNTRSQTRLNRAAREENVRQAFLVQHAFRKNHTVFLVDDVVTTGATMNACAAALKAAGFSTIIGIAVATPREAFLDHPLTPWGNQSTD